MMLDTEHLPKTQPFEVGLLGNLSAAGYRGIVLLDDIRLNAEMAQFWRSCQEWAERRGYRAHDLTEVGHFSGTGLIDFTPSRVFSFVSTKSPARGARGSLRGRRVPPRLSRGTRS